MKRILKIYSIILISMVITIIAGCSNDKNEDTTNNTDAFTKLTHTSGEQIVNGVNVLVTSSASSTSNWCDYGPYWAGYTGNGYYEFTFTPAISGVKLDFAAINGIMSGGGIEEVQVYINDIHYNLTDNFSANSCEDKAQINTNGNLTGSEIKLYGCKDLKIDGSINKLKIYDKHLSGLPGGTVFSINIKK